MYTEEQYANHVRELQHYLRTLSLADKRYPLLAVDGFFWPETTHAVRVFQEINGLPVTGKIDRAAWECLVQEYNKALLPFAPTQTISVFPSPQFILKPGDSGPFVYILQIMLNAIAALFSGFKSLELNGVYDPATVERIVTFKRMADYPDNTSLDRSFWDYLAVWYNSLVEH